MSDGSLGLLGVLYYLFVGLIVLAVPVAAFYFCGGRRYLRRWFVNDKRAHDGYQRVHADADLEK